MTPSFETQKPYYGRSITDLVAFFFVLAAASFATIVIPIQEFHSKFPTDTFVRIEQSFGALLLPAAWILYMVGTTLWRRRQRRLAREISSLMPESRISRFFPPEIQAVLDSHNIECRLSGPLDAQDPDPTEQLTAPQIVLPGIKKPILILPTRALARLIVKPDALKAVILHEIGHVVSRDSRRLDDTKRAISIFIWLVALYSMASIGASYHLDSQNGDRFTAFLSDMEGKSLLIVATFQIILFAVMRSFLEPLREKIADNFVISQMGTGEGLATAEAMLAGRMHTTDTIRGNVRRPGYEWFLLFGALTGIAISNLGGFLSYFAGEVATGRSATTAQYAADVLYTYLPVAICSWMLFKVFGEEQSFSLPKFLWISLLFGLGSWGIYFADHFVPVALVARISEQYANVIRDDVGAVAFEGMTSILSDNLEKALYGFAIAFALCNFVASRWRKPTLAVLIGIYVVVDFQIRLQARAMLRFTEYDLYAWSVIFLGATALFFVRRYSLAARPRMYAACVLIVFVYASLRLEGYKEVSLRTTVATTAGTESFDASEWSEAKQLFSEAHKSSRRGPVPMVWLGDVEDKLNNPKGAAYWYDKALAVRGWSSWNERIYALGHSADEHVDLRSKADLEIARSRLKLALEMRRENGRLGKKDVAFSLGVYSYLLAVHGSDHELPFSLLLLAESCRMYPANHFYEAFAKDPDISRLDLVNGPRELPADAATVLGEHPPSYAEDLWRIIETRWNPQERAAFARLIAYNASHE
jgi:Zn-dependent protease with chaperone function